MSGRLNQKRGRSSLTDRSNFESPTKRVKSDSWLRQTFNGITKLFNPNPPRPPFGELHLSPARATANLLRRQLQAYPTTVLHAKSAAASLSSLPSHLLPPVPRPTSLTRTALPFPRAPLSRTPSPQLLAPLRAQSTRASLRLGRRRLRGPAGGIKGRGRRWTVLKIRRRCGGI